MPRFTQKQTLSRLKRSGVKGTGGHGRGRERTCRAGSSLRLPILSSDFLYHSFHSLVLFLALSLLPYLQSFSIMPVFFHHSAFAVLSLQFVNLVLAQGDAAAAVGGQKNNPRKDWQQWQPKPTYELDALPIQYMGSNRIPGGGEPQTGWNQCANNTWNQKSLCQTAWINNILDWCIWGPPDGGDIGSTERIAVAYCTTGKHGTRVIPDGTLTGAHFLKTPSYVQVSGIGDFTSIGIPQGDDGGEMVNIDLR